MLLWIPMSLAIRTLIAAANPPTTAAVQLQPASEPAVRVIVATNGAIAGKLSVRWTSEVQLAADERPNVSVQLDKAVDIHTKDAMEMVKGTDNAKAPRTGADYLRLSRDGFEPKTNYDNKKGSWFKAATLPLVWLEHVKPADKSYLGDWNPSIDPRGALGLLPSSLGFSGEGPTRELWKYEWPQSITSTRGPWSITIDDGAGFETIIEIVAWGDANGDGVEDALLSVNQYATQGTFCAYSFIAVTRQALNGPFKVIGEVR